MPSLLDLPIDDLLGEIGGAPPSPPDALLDMPLAQIAPDPEPDWARMIEEKPEAVAYDMKAPPTVRLQAAIRAQDNEEKRFVSEFDEKAYRDKTHSGPLAIGLNAATGGAFRKIHDAITPTPKTYATASDPIYLAKKMPFMGSALDAVEQKSLNEVLKKVADGTAERSDYSVYARAIRKAEKRGDWSFAAKLTDGLLETSKLMAELVTPIGPAGSVTSIGAQGAKQGIIGGGKLALKQGALAAAVDAPGLALAAQRRMAPTLTPQDDGTFKKRDGMGVLPAIGAGFVDQATQKSIEIGGGRALNAALGKIIPKKMIGSLFSQAAAKVPGLTESQFSAAVVGAANKVRQASQATRRATGGVVGGPFEEWTEERWQEVAGGLLGTPEHDSFGTIGAIARGDLKGAAEQQAIEGIIIGLFTAPNIAAQLGKPNTASEVEEVNQRLGPRQDTGAIDDPAFIAQWATENPDAAATLAFSESPSRKQWEEAGLPRGVNGKKREAFAAQVRQQLAAPPAQEEAVEEPPSTDPRWQYGDPQPTADANKTDSTLEDTSDFQEPQPATAEQEAPPTMAEPAQTVDTPQGTYSLRPKLSDEEMAELKRREQATALSARQNEPTPNPKDMLPPQPQSRTAADVTDEEVSAELRRHMGERGIVPNERGLWDHRTGELTDQQLLDTKPNGWQRLKDQIAAKRAKVDEPKRLGTINTKTIAPTPAPSSKPEVKRVSFPRKEVIQREGEKEGRQDQVLAPAAEPAPEVMPAQESDQPTGFRTARGSTYTLDKDGRTTRTKSYHPEHGKEDVGPKERSEKTYYVEEDAVREIGMWNTSSAPGKRIVVRGDEIILTSMNPKTGKRGSDGRFKIKSQQPVVGLHPVELWEPDSNGFYRGNHPGNAITELSSDTESAQKPPALEDIVQYPVQEIPLDQLTLSPDVPQFKEDADEDGIVVGQRLQGKYNRLGTAPIIVWQRTDGRKEVITGRHRFDLAKRSGEKTIPSQIVKEEDGFTREQAILLDAESNIQDEKGSIRDFASYFRNSPITEAEATQRGLRSRAAQRQAFRLGKDAEDQLYTAWRANRITADKAAAIAEAAPRDDALQAAGLAQADSLSADELKSMIALMKARSKDRKSTSQGDLFGFDDSAIQDMATLAKAAAQIQNDLKEERASIKGAAKRPDRAQKYLQGDFDTLPERVEELDALIDRWDRWTTDKELFAQAEQKAAEGKAQTKKRLAPKKGEAAQSYAKPREPAKPVGGVTQADVPVTTEVTPNPEGAIAAHDIVATMSRSFGVPVRYGRVPSNIEGRYLVWQEVVEVQGREMGSLAVEAHEVAHHMDKKTGLSSTPGIQAALATLDYGPNGDVHEGVAEFFRLYITDPDLTSFTDPAKKAEKQAAYNKVKEYVEKEWLPAHPKWAKAVEQAKRLVTHYRTQSPQQRVSANTWERGRRAEVLEMTPGERVREGIRNLAEAVSINLGDRLAWSRRIDKEREARGGKLKPGENTAEELARWGDGSIITEVYAAIQNGVRTISSGKQRKLSKGLPETLAPLKQDEYEEWDNYHKAVHVIDVYDNIQEKGLRPYNPGMREDDARAIVGQVEADPEKAKRFKQVSKDFTDIFNGSLDMLADAGVIEAREAAAMKDYHKRYASLRRANPHTRSLLSTIGFSEGALNLGRGVSKRSKAGSGRPVMPQIESLMYTLAERYHTAMLHVVKRGILNQVIRRPDLGLNGVEGMGEFARIVDPKLKPVTINVEEALKQLEEAGIVEAEQVALWEAVDKLRTTPTPDAIKTLKAIYGTDDVQQLKELTADVPRIDTIIRVFKPDYRPSAAENIERFVIKNKPVLIEWDPVIYRSFREMGPMQLNATEKVLASWGNLVKLGATGISDKFVLNNIFSDWFTNLFQAKHQKISESFYSPLKSLGQLVGMYVTKAVTGKDALGKNEAIELLDEVYGRLAHEFNLDAAGVTQTKKRLMARSLAGRVMASGVAPLRTASEFFSLSDLGPRLAELKAGLREMGYELRKDGKDIRIYNTKTNTFERPTIEELRKLRLAVKDVTTDFSRSGRYVRKISSVYVPYVAPAIAGTHKMVRTIQSAAAGDVKARTRLIWMGSTMVAIEALRWFFTHDDDDEQEKEAWQKKAYWTDDYLGKKFKKPPSWSWLPNAVHATLDALFAGKPETTKEMLAEELGSLVPVEVDRDPEKMLLKNAAKVNLVGPVVEYVANYDAFRDTEIESPDMQRNSPSQRYDARTTTLAKEVGGATGFSPKKLDHVANRATGGMYNRLAEGKTPFVGALDYRESSKSRKEFKAKREELDRAKADAKKNGQPWTDAQQAELARLEDYAEIRNGVYGLMRTETDEKKLEFYEGYITGAARAAMRKTPLLSYPDPMTDPKAPKAIKELRIPLVERRFRALLANEPEAISKTDKEKKISLPRKQKNAEENRREARKWLRTDSGLTRREIEKAVETWIEGDLSSEKGRAAKLKAFQDAMGW